VKEISSLANVEVSHLLQLTKSSSYRKSQQKILVEGRNLLKDLLQRHDPIRLFLTKTAFAEFSDFPGEIVVISDAIANKISSVETPEGYFAEFHLPKHTVPSIQKGLILDRLSDPGNVGTLLRTALGFMIDVVFLIEPCCDVWNPKTLRAAKGAQFDLPIIPISYENLPQQLPIIVADTKGIFLHEFKPPNQWLLVLGNEAFGPNVPPEIQRTTVTIKTPGPIESLNVATAGAIVLYALTHASP
jgi:RNA methyltransferase, TrmH family